jgi:protein-tyrosine phosphatase
LRSILFVCTANICRSPLAEAVFRQLITPKARENAFEVASAGTHDYHIGKPAFPTAMELAKLRGFDLTGHVARRVKAGDFDHFDLILGMDRSNIASLRTIAPTRCKQKIELLLEYGDEFHGEEVPDPYGGEVEDFERAMDMIEDGCRGLVKLLAR